MGSMRSMEVRSVGTILYYMPKHRCSAMNKARLSGFPASKQYGSRTMKHKGSLLWNGLSKSLECITSFDLFKKKLKLLMIYK
jgi:hypothetical protein